MMAGRRTAALMGAAFLTATWGTVAHAQDYGQGQSLDQRVSRLERLLNSQNLVDMYTHIQQLQQDVEQLRGQVEVQNNTIDELKKRQRDLYLDLDRRVSALERGGTAAPTAGGKGGGAVSALLPAPNATSAPAPAMNTPAPSAANTGAANTGLGEQGAYERAFDLLRNLRYDQAIAAFQGFLKQFPKSAYDHMAQYWIGEADYAQQHYKMAIADYQKLIANYPHSPKVPEAMLKIGYSRFELGDKAGASAMLKKLNAQFPDTTEASQGQKLLQKIHQAG